MRRVIATCPVARGASVSSLACAIVASNEALLTSAWSISISLFVRSRTMRAAEIWVFITMPISIPATASLVIDVRRQAELENAGERRSNRNHR